MVISTLIVVLRIIPLLAFATSMVLSNHRRKAEKGQICGSGRDRVPVVANFGAFGVYVASLLVFSRSAAGSTALLLAFTGSALGVAGAAFVVRSRAALGPAWSFVPKADDRTGLVTTGPYRLVRHPIYFGLLLIAAGEALAFGSWPALTIVLFGIVPTFAWRARAEEELLSRTFGDRYAVYRQRTKMIIPHLF